jgi:replicative DNA helicase
VSPERRDHDRAAADYDRTPPQDLAAEQCVLGGMMLSKDAIADVLEIVRSTDFYRPAHGAIFDMILDLYGRGEPADVITVSAAFVNAGDIDRVGGAAYLHTLIASVPTAANSSYYARIVAERAVLRRLVEAGTRIVQMGYGSAAGQGRDVDDIVDLAQQAVYDVTERRSSEDFAILGDLLQPALDEIEAVGSRDGVMAGVPTGFGDLDRLLNGLHPGQLVVVAGRPGLGKALALETPLPTPDGWIRMGDVRVGDRLLDAAGRPTRVTAVSDVMTDRPCYEVEFSDGSVIVADADHRWLTHTRTGRRSGRPASVRTTEQIRATLRVGAGRLNHSVPTTSPLDLPARDLPIAPYTLGVWLGDGHSRAARFATSDLEIVAFIEADGYAVRDSGPMVYTIASADADPAPHRNCDVCGARFSNRSGVAGHIAASGRRLGRAAGGDDEPAAELCADCRAMVYGPSRPRRPHPVRHTVPGTLTSELRDLGLLGTKRIPARYLRASESQRRALLAGILDAIGTVSRAGAVQVGLASGRLAGDLHELVISLGYRCTITRAGGPGTGFTVRIPTADEVFRLERKRIVHKERCGTARDGKDSRRYIVDVRAAESVPVRCVSVDNEDRLYLAGRSMIATHNSTASMDFARNASVRHNLPSAIFSLEMSKIEIVTRLLSAEARVPLHVLRSGQLSDDDWTRLARRMGEISEAPIFIDDTPNMTLMEIRAKARRLRQRNDLKLVVVDYLQLMTSPKRVESRQQEVADLSRGLKLLAKEIECPVVAVSQLNRGPEQRTDKRPQLSDLRESGCLVASTRLLRADTNEEVTLGALVATGATNVAVWALDDRLKYVPRTLTHAFPSGRKVVYRMRTASGKEVEATGSHRFLTPDGWTPLEQLAKRGRIAVPRHIPAPLQPKEWPSDHIILLAHLLGDGSFVRRQSIRSASGDEANLAAVAAAAAGPGFGSMAIRDEDPVARATTTRLPAAYRLGRGRCNPAAEWLDGLALFGTRSHEKYVPGDVFALPRSQVALFLRHLWATGGSVSVNKSGSSGRVYYASTSPRLVQGVGLLLWRFGITARIRTVVPKAGRTLYTLDISGRDDQLRFLREVGVHGTRAAACHGLVAALERTRTSTNVDTVPKEVWSRVREILAEPGMTHRESAAATGTRVCGSTAGERAPSRDRLARIVAVLDAEDLDLHATNDVLWDEIVSIERVGEEDVFDATVLGSHNFVANGIAAHNSIEQDADVVILLHRDDYYDKESPRAGEADFIVAKHRNGPTDTVTVAAQLHFSRFMDMAIN